MGWGVGVCLWRRNSNCKTYPIPSGPVLPVRDDDNALENVTVQWNCHHTITLTITGPTSPCNGCDTLYNSDCILSHWHLNAALVLWKDKDLCNLPELNHPLKACQAAFCRSQEVVIPRSISLCWPGESVFLSALLCACWCVLAYRVRLFWSSYLLESSQEERGILCRVHLRL